MKREILIEALAAMLRKRAAQKRAGVTPESGSPFAVNLPAEILAYAEGLRVQVENRIEALEDRIEVLEQRVAATKARHWHEIEAQDEELRALSERVEALEARAGVSKPVIENLSPEEAYPPAPNDHATYQRNHAAFARMLQLYVEAPADDRMAGLRKLSASERMHAMELLQEHPAAARALVEMGTPLGETLQSLYGSTQIPDPTFDDVLMSFAQTLAILGTRVVM